MVVHQGVSTEPAGLAELAELLREATGESRDWAARVTPESRIEDDLELESVELAALCELLPRKYGPRADLWELLAGLDFDQLIALTVGDLLGYLGRCEGGAGGTGRGPAAGAPEGRR